MNEIKGGIIMGLREDALAVLNFEEPENFPIVHFGFWPETIERWHQEGHVPAPHHRDVFDNSESEKYVSHLLGFDFNWSATAGGKTGLMPPLERKVLETMPDGKVKIVDENGAILLTKPGVVSIPSEVGHLLEDRASWQKHFLPRLEMNRARIDEASLRLLQNTEGRTQPLGIQCGSLFGEIRNWLGLEGSAYLLLDDEPLFTEIIDTFAKLQFDVLQAMLERGAQPDYAHFWEDICCKSGPLIRPQVFRDKVGPWYRRFSQLLSDHGIDIVSVDCDGVIDDLLPIWLENGVNTMFPIEVGVWNASIKPWRQAYGPQVRGVGGMNKTVFARDYAAVDAEIERLMPLIELGGYLPCPDHRIAPDARWENVQHYCDRLRRRLS